MNEFIERVSFSDNRSRYDFAKAFIENKKVLDSACGTGYWTNYLTKGSPEIVIGVDLSLEAISHAKIHFCSERIIFACGNCRHFPLPASWFDVITSFEFIEHIYEQEEYLQEL
jgi:2-polyprenyl-3-methyl-5-hydroxy-6-metoxy-1,4-benzoquinol methylase